MKVTHTVKVFMWWACINALPTKANLFRRKIIEDPLCPLVDLLWRLHVIFYGGEGLLKMSGVCAGGRSKKEV